MSTNSPPYINALQHRQLVKSFQDQSPNDLSPPPDSSITSRNASKLAIEAFEENKRLIAQLESIQRYHAAEIQKLKNSYDSRIAQLSQNEEKYIAIIAEKNALIENLKKQTMDVDKDKIIEMQNQQIQKLTNQYESLMTSRAFQSDALHQIMDKLEVLSKENQYYKSRIENIDFQSPSPQRQQQSTISRTNIETPRRNFAESSTQSPPDTDYVSRMRSRFQDDDQAIRKAFTPPIMFGRKRAPPNHPALAEQIVFDDNSSFNSKFSSDPEFLGFSVDEMKVALDALNNEKTELVKNLSKALPNDHSSLSVSAKMLRERDETRLDQVEKMIRRIRLELMKLGKLA